VIKYVSRYFVFLQKKKLPMNAIKLVASVLAVAGVATAISRPLGSLEGFYDLHLFPQRDRFDYEVSETHKFSQILHIFTLITMLVGLVFCVIDVILAMGNRAASAASNKIAAAMIAMGTTSYIAAMMTLIKVMMDYAHIVDDLPVHPKVDVREGFIMDIVGVLFAVFAVIATVVKSRNNEGGIRI
jgi:hypothetical protein